jgi:hypothetical protein
MQAGMTQPAYIQVLSMPKGLWQHADAGSTSLPRWNASVQQQRPFLPYSPLLHLHCVEGLKQSGAVIPRAHLHTGTGRQADRQAGRQTSAA